MTENLSAIQKAYILPTMIHKEQTFGGVVKGYDSLVVAELARQHGRVIHIADTDAHLQTIAEQLSAIAPDIDVWPFPAWDTVPYDRSAPHSDIEGVRIRTMCQLEAATHTPALARPTVVLTCLAAVMQKVPPLSFWQNQYLDIHKGDTWDERAVFEYLSHTGYLRTAQVMEQGQYAVRGGIVDIFPAGDSVPYRLDLFGDTIDDIRPFDPLTQKTDGTANHITLLPIAEFTLDDKSKELFRTRYRTLFGSAGQNDDIYRAVSEGRKVAGLEHWLPLFFDKLVNILTYAPDALITHTPQQEAQINDHFAQIKDYYAAREQTSSSSSSLTGTADGLVYRPVPVGDFFCDAAVLTAQMATHPVICLSPFTTPEETTDKGGRLPENFAAHRQKDVFETVADYVKTHIKEHVVVAAFSAISQERIVRLLQEKDVPVSSAASWAAAVRHTPAVAVLPFEHGFKSPAVTVFSETDILGEKRVRPTRYKKSAENFIEDISTLSIGDYVVHINHGIGRFDGLETINVGGVSHDCLKIVYADDDKLFVPVENLDVLTRYGSSDSTVTLDKLGGLAWEARKERVKKRLFEMAGQLIEIAAARLMRPSNKIYPPQGAYDEFCAQFGYIETPDQAASVGQVLADFAAGHPMDRLICGDVGFGKTEVALRAAFVAAMNGLQVALVCPTTLLARQHYDTFTGRFADFPIRLGCLSRLIPSKQAAATRRGLANGSVQVVVGTHALLSKNLSFHNLGLLIVDEEQHFGVMHKERLKALKADLHVLTLTATPIPRTLQMSLTGVRDLSVIATPPVDRMAINTFVMAFDSVTVRDALLREKARGGQSFYICPRIGDMPPLLNKLHTIVPELKIAAAHGQMAGAELDAMMNDFMAGKYDVLLATSIIESGLDMPRVNTIIIHHADRFGLAALYQLRGRVGRAKVKAYAYLTTESGKLLTPAAEKRLAVMQSLDSLGAGFSLASHDLDIRGAGNLLGQEQSGHIKEVGAELYQRMLEDAVAEWRTGKGLSATTTSTAEQQGVAESPRFSPQLNLGFSVLIPDTYVADLGVRMELYHRLANIEDTAPLKDLRDELADRFGATVPEEVDNLLATVELKILCKAAFVEKLDVGNAGATLSFYRNEFPHPAGLVSFINAQHGLAKLKPDKLIISRTWTTSEDKLNGLRRILSTLAALAQSSAS